MLCAICTNHDKLTEVGGADRRKLERRGADFSRSSMQLSILPGSDDRFENVVMGGAPMASAPLIARVAGQALAVALITPARAFAIYRF
jgi:hypothetical protein